MLFIILAACIAVLLYLYHVNRAIMAVPEEARRLCPHRWTVDEIKAAFEKVQDSPTDVAKSLPPKQSRRYIVVGGSGAFQTLIQEPDQSQSHVVSSFDND